MNVLFLAGGFGTRLGEFGEETPKGLIEVGPTTLVGKAIAEVRRMGKDVAHIGMVTNERFVDRFGRWLVGEGYAKEMQFVSDGAKTPEKRLGAIGDIVFASEKFGWQDDLLVIPSDTYYSFSLADFVTFARKKGQFCTVLRKVPTEVIKGRLGCAVIDGDRITSFVEKPEDPPSDFAAIPFYYYPKEILGMIDQYKKEGGNMDAPGSIIPWLLAKKIPVFAYLTDGETLDVGTTDDVKKLQNFL